MGSHSISTMTFVYRAVTLIAAALAALPVAAAAASDGVAMTITPAASGRQLVRVSLPLPRGFLRKGQTLEVRAGARSTRSAVRVLTEHPPIGKEPRSARRAMVTFPYVFGSRSPVRFDLRPVLE